MKRLRFALIAAMLTLPLAVVGVVAKNMRNRLPSDVEIIEAPRAWVPFQAKFTVSHPGQPLIHGRFYRSSIGSVRKESGPAPDDVRVIRITNLADRTVYGFHYKFGWMKAELTKAKTVPPQFIARALSEFPYALAIEKGQSGSLQEKDMGLTAYEYRHAGVVALKVPALNFFDVVLQRHDGRYEAYTDIERIEPKAEVFVPPPGVKVAIAPRRPATPTSIHGDHSSE